MQISYKDAVRRYGEIIDSKWPQEVKWCSVLPVPTEFWDTWMNSMTGNPVKKIYCNVDMQRALTRALGNIVSRGLVSELKTFDGCYQVRGVRGVPGVTSTHSYALAIDINAKTNKLGEKPSLGSDVVACFVDEGFSWGGGFRRLDGMHFSYAWE